MLSKSIGQGGPLCLRHASLCLGGWFISWVKSGSGFSGTGNQAADNTINMAVMRELSH